MTRLVPVTVLAILACAVPARAELVFFASGRTMSIKGHRMDGDALVLQLRAGGEIICEPSAVAGITPDEVPYPEPEAEAKPDTINSADQGAAPGRLMLAKRYAPVIDKIAAEQGVPSRLVRAVIQVESAYNERARSRKGAMGLMQLMPDTARQYAVADPYDPVSNIAAGIKHLKTLLQRYPQPLALAAYNAGEGAVQRFGGIPPYPETRDYVTRILNLVGR